MVSKYDYNIISLDIRRGSDTSQTINNQSFEKQININNGSRIRFQDGIGTNGPVSTPSDNLYGVPGGSAGEFPDPTAKISKSNRSVNGYWGNKNQEKINFNKNNRTDAYSLGKNYIKDGQNLTPIYNLTNNTIRNFTLPNGQNLLSFLKKNNVQNGENVQIKITKDGVVLQKTESN